MGNANITRDQFKASNLTVRKLFQQNTVFLDSDSNEVGQIAGHRSARILHELANKKHIRFGSGWQITGGVNQVTISAGDAALHVNDDDLSNGLSDLFHLASNADIGGWSTPSGSDRTDYLYLDVEYPIIDADDDPVLINPDHGKESAVDIRQQYSFQITSGVAVPSAPAGHYYITIATIERSAGAATIEDIDITNHIEVFEPLQSTGKVNLKGDMSVDSGKTIDGIDLDKSINVIFTQSINADLGSVSDEVPDWDAAAGCWSTPNDATATWYKKHRSPLYKKDNIKHVRLRFECKNLSGTATPRLRFTVNGFTAESHDLVQDTSWHVVELTVDVSAATENDDLHCLIEIQSPGASLSTLLIRKAQIYTTVV